MPVDKAIGLVLGSAIAPSDLASAARTAEQGGFDEIWLAEDFFFTGGISGASLVLSSTERTTVGLGVVSAMVRHPALLAMEISTISAAYPGRLIAGIGLGVPGWIRQMGLHPRSPLAAMRECVSSVRRLLQGKMLDEQGDVFDFHDVRLTYPETGVPTPIHMGVSGPKMLRLSGEIAQGTVLSVAAGHDYVRWARERIDEGRRSAGRSGPHRITLFAIYSVADDPQEARQAVRGPLAFYKSLGTNALTDVYGMSEQLRGLIDRGGYQAVRDGMPDQWIEDLTIAGSPEEVAAKIESFYEIGVDCVALFPMPSDQVGHTVAQTTEQVLPLLSPRI